MKKFSEFIVEITKNDVKHGLRLSKMDRSYAERALDYHELHLKSKGRVEKLHPNHIRALQTHVDKRWSPERKADTNWGHKEPIGIRDSKGVHLLDGTHRAEHARKNNKHISVRVWDHRGHHKNFEKWRWKED